MSKHIARKRFGQNFLQDPRTIADIVEAVRPAYDDLVIEIGPGLGAITRPLLAQLATLHVVEIDRDIIARLKREFPADRLTIHEGDALAFDFASIGGSAPLKIVGNLPYNISTPLLFHLARFAHRVVDMHFMLQKEVIERMVAGDISYDSMGLLDATHVRFYSPASAFKTFLDAGWLPHLRDQYRVEVPQTHFAAKIVEAAQLLGVPAETALHNLGCYQMIIVCRKWAMEALRGQGTSAPISVIVPVNRPWQYELNIARSPGLKEIGAEIIPVQGADSAAAAYTWATQRARHAWHLLVHQDVYFPTGSGFALARQLVAEIARRLTKGSTSGLGA